MSHITKGFDSYDQKQSSKIGITFSEARAISSHNIEVLLSIRDKLISETCRDFMPDDVIDSYRCLEGAIFSAIKSVSNSVSDAIDSRISI